jgi:hypothetical protein
MKPDPTLTRAIADRVRQLPEADLRKLLASSDARKAFADMAAKLSQPEQRKDSK